MIYCNDLNNVVFIILPKCGSTDFKNNIIDFLKYKNYKFKNGISNNNLNNYKFIVIIRNPFERIVSLFLDRCRDKKNFTVPESYCTNKFKKNNIKITFKNCINLLIKHKWDILDRHHFSPYTENLNILNDNRIDKKNIIVYDLKNIDYNYIGTLFNIVIPEEVINRRWNRFSSNYYSLWKYEAKEIVTEKIYDKEITEYLSKNKPELKYFFNKDIKNQVLNFYKDDFIFANSYNFHYNIDV